MVQERKKIYGSFDFAAKILSLKASSFSSEQYDYLKERRQKDLKQFACQQEDKKEKKAWKN